VKVRTASNLLSFTILSGVAGLLVLSAAGSASAQEVTPPANAQDEPAELGEVVVTGTRIRVPDYEGSAPVASVSGEAIRNAGVTNVTDFLTDQPALVSSTTLQDNSNAGDRGSVGLNLLDLRNLGSQRTLVLVNGRRHVAAQPGSQAVDINTIPVALIERVDILTGGTSAIYGADGVSGVVNFILRDDYEGFDMRAQTGWSDGGGGDNNFVSVLKGWNLLDGQVNFTVGAEFSKTNALGREDRDFSAVATAESLTGNPDYGLPGEFQQDFFRNARYIDTSPGGSSYADIYFGSIFGDPGSFSGVDFNGDGTPFQDGIYSEGFVMIGGDGSQLAAFGTDLIPELERASLNATFNIEIIPRATFFGEFKYVNTKTQFQSQPSFDYSIFVPIDNPFIPQSIVDAATGPDGLATPAGVDYFRNFFGDIPGPGVLVARDNFDLGFITRDVDRSTYRGVVGLRGDFTDNLSYEVSLNYGRTDETNTEGNNRINERFFAAVDSVDEGEFLTGVPNGNIVCRSNLDPDAIPYGNAGPFGSDPFDQDTWGTTFTPGANSGCVPMNIFGDGSPSAASLDWVMTDSTTLNSVEQFVANAFISGDTTGFLELPGGPISFVLGGEYRQEEASSQPSILEIQAAMAAADITWLGEAVPLNGGFHVKEIFGEVYLPLLKDLPFVQNLTLNGAYRYSDYSTAGGADAWNVGLRWDLNDSFGLRSSVARAVRAPNISELFLPVSQTFAILDDPCDDDNFQAGDNPALREANCRAALGIAPGAPYTFNNTTSSSVEGVIGGNPDLSTEQADTFTAGLVFRPTFLSGFSLTLDYYDIELEDAIQFFSAQAIVDKCYDLPQPNQFCGLITRDANTQFIDSFEQFGVNVASYKTVGYDMTIRYLLDPANFGIQQDIGRFGFSLSANKLEELTFTEDPNDPLSIDETVGEAFVPEWQASLDLSWEWKNLFVNYGYAWFDETVRFENRPDDYIDPAYLNYSARSVHDIQVRYTIDDRISVYGGVNNIGDQQPDRGLSDYPVGPLGRYFYLGMNLSL
jgi:outer membrane receptor protein involved in Fe transport